MVRKALNLGMAVYRVTRHFPEGEVLIGQLRTVANEIVRELTVENTEQAVSQLKIILNYLQIAQKQQWTKEINFVILRREYQKLYDEVKNRPAAASKIKKGCYRPTARQKNILSYIKEQESVKLGNLKTLFPGVSPRTISKDLKKLVEKKMISREGNKKGSFYILIKGI